MPAFPVSLGVCMELSLSEFRVVKMEKHIVITEWKRYTIRHAEHIHKCTLRCCRKGVYMDINQKITEELGVKRWQVDAAVKLIDEGNTIPFIARYRKEAHGTLDDEQLRKLAERPTCATWKRKKNRYWQALKNRGNLQRSCETGSLRRRRRWQWMICIVRIVRSVVPEQ